MDLELWALLLLFMLIYCIENTINNKIYIGQTICIYNERKNKHSWQLNTNQHENQYLQNSWNKHGEDNFRFFILEDGFKTIKELNEAEQFWISCLQALAPHGYNLQSGGSNSRHHKTTRLKQSKANSKPICKYSLEGNLLDIYDSITEAAEKHDGFITNLVSTLKGITKSAYGFQWRYLTNESKDKVKSFKGRNEVKKNKGDSKVTAQYNLEDELWGVYPSAAEASRQTDISSSSIRMACGGTYKQAGGYKWKYLS